MKKKIAIVAVALLLVAGSILGTLAYLTSTDSATNTFTVSTTGVKIQLIEQERNADGSELQTFTQNKTIYPTTGSAQGVKDKWGLPVTTNYVDKIVTVKNLAEDAYVRVYVAVPAVLENDDASLNILHWNYGNKFCPNGDYAQAGQVDGQKNAPDYTANMGSVVQLAGTTNIGEIEYNVYYQTYKKALDENEVTGSAFLIGMYLDKSFEIKETENGTKEYYAHGKKINYDFTNIEIPVVAVGVQAAGFTDADAAINEAFGANYNPWAN